MSQGFYGFPNILGLLRATNLRVTGKAGATAGAGLAGGTTSGAPTSGQFDVGDLVVGQDGTLRVCTVDGSPGTWVAVNDPTTAFSWGTKTAAYTLASSDSGILADATSAAFTLTLPTAVGATQQYAVKKKDSSTHKVTVATTSGQTIDGSSTQTLSQQSDTIHLASDGSNWYILAALLGPVEALAYAATSDLANGTALGAGTWTDLVPNQTFTVEQTGSFVEIFVSVGCLVGTTGAGCSSRLVVDSAGTTQTKPLGGMNVPGGNYSNPFNGAGPATVRGLAAGSHTVKLQVISASANSLYCRASSSPDYESASINIVEWKR